MMAWLRGMITMPRLVTRSHAVAHTSEVGDAAKANTHTPCKASAPAITARRPTASLTPLRAGTKISWTALTPAATHFRKPTATEEKRSEEG